MVAQGCSPAPIGKLLPIPHHRLGAVSVVSICGTPMNCMVTYPLDGMNCLQIPLEAAPCLGQGSAEHSRLRLPASGWRTRWKWNHLRNRYGRQNRLEVKQYEQSTSFVISRRLRPLVCPVLPDL